KPLRDHPSNDKPLKDGQTNGDRTPRDHAVDSIVTLRCNLLRTGEQFISHRLSVSGPTIMAGYPWLGDWSRNTLIALPGLALTTKRFGIARQILQSFAQHCTQGLMPDALPAREHQPSYNNLDVSLWWIETLGLYLKATQDWRFLEEQYPTVQKIYKALTVGTLHNIRVDAVDGLLTWNSPDIALTWMDAAVDGKPVTPRLGKAIEINALWYSSLCWARQWAEQLQIAAMEQGNEEKVKTFTRQIQRYEQHIDHVRDSLKIFWNPQRGYFYDTIGPDDSPDASIRPNGIIALSLSHCGFSENHAKQALNLAHDRLLTPYGLRSLDPANADYKGHYAGNMTYRDRAYHQGTVWSWLIGPFIRAWKRFHGDLAVPFNAVSLLSHVEHQVCMGSVSEIFDGDAPHFPQGAVSQAWSVAELIRHWDDLF
ncbi:MAG: amylo-alpha-1,6-glucosidase, partial [Merismopedia sp. SIO2A8]|nr:amylo-alpha-1,6-glucosidase [Merismopedia sp. SIO2A8]